MTKVNIPSMLVSPNSPTPKSTNSIYSLFSLKTPSIKSSLKSPQKSPIKSFKSTTTSSKKEIKYVLNGAKRVLTKFQHFNHHHELCVKCTGFIEQVIKILENVGTLSKNKRDQLIETKEYNDCSTSISEIEYYFKKHDQENSNPSEVKESLKKFVLNLEIVVNAIQRASEHLKTKKGSKWSPSNVSKIKTIGKLMVMKKESDRIKDDGDFVPLTHEEEPVIQQGLNIPTCEVEEPSNIPTSVEDPLNVPTSQKENPIEPVIQREVIIPKSLSREDESPNETIIQQDIIMPTGFIKQELIIPTGLNREGNYEGMFFNNKLSEKCIGIISRDDIKFTKFKDEMSYLMDLSCGCNNILSVKGFTERSIKENPSILIYIVNFLSSFFFNYKNKHATMLVTEWAEFNLPDYLKKNDLDWSAKLSIARGIANALNHIHNLNLLHYNVKSDSVLLDHDLEPKLHKFGKDAKDCVFLKSAGSLKPSNWSAPEVKRGGKYTSASEVYSFGVILWEIATQECLSGNKSIDKRDIVDAPTNYLTIMKSALDQEPQNRPTMQEMFDTLSQLESFYSARQQKQQNLSIRNIINIINTNSAVSSSSEDLTIDSASSRVTSRANSPAPSISDQEYMFFTNNVNITSKVENSTDNDEFTVSESTSSIEKSPTVNADDTEKSSIFTTNNVDYHSDTENSTTIINNVETNAEKSPTSTNDIDYHSDIEISTSTNDVDYHSDTESSTNFTKDVETIAEKSPTSTNNVDYHSDTEILTSTNVVDYHSDTESSTNFIKDVETNAEKSPTSTNDVDYHSDTEIPTSTNDVDYHSDTESSTNFTKDVETNAEKSPTSTIDVDYHSDTEISTSTNDVDYHLDTESSTNFTKDVEANAEKSPSSTNDVDYHSETESSTNFTKDVETNAEKSPTSTNDVDNYSNFFQGTHTYSIIVVKYFKHIHDCNKCQELEKMLIQSDKKVFPMEARDIDTTTSSSVSNNTFVIYHSDTEISTSTNDIDCHSGTESSTNFTKDVETNAEKSPAFTNDVDYHSDTESSTNFTKNVETNADKSPTFTNDVGCHSGTESSTNFSKNVETNADKSPTSTNDVDYHSDTESSISTYNVDYHSDTESSTNFTKNVETNADESPTSTNDVGCHSDIESSTNFTKDVDAIAEKSPPSTNDVDYHSSTEISTFINDCHSGTERYADKSPTSTNNVDYHSDTESSISTNDVGCHSDTESSISTNDVDCHSDTESLTNFTKDVETNAEKSPTSTIDVDYHSDTESSISTYNVDYHSDTENSTTITNNVETNAENSPTFTNNVAHNSNIEILPTLTIDIKSTSNIEKSSSTIIHHVESASNAENSPTFTNNIKSTSDTVILTNDVNSASNIENIYLNEFKKLHNNKQYRKAFKLINGYAKLDPKVLFWMGYYHYKGYHESSPYKPDIMTSLKYLEAGAKLNDPDAQYYYSHIIFHCCLNGIENGYEIALKHLKKASEQNHPASMLELGKYMINGKFGCKKDITSGKTLIRRAKELGNRSANSDQKVDGMKARKYQRASNASTSPLKRNVYQRRSRTSSNASSASSIRSMIVSKSFSSKKTNTITMDQT